MAKTTNDLRSQLRATSIKKLKEQVERDDQMVGAYASNEYLNLEDGKTLKIRIFPAHPGEENFYVAKKCYWLSIAGNDGDMKRTQVLDSRTHGGTKMDLIDEYVKWAKKKWAKDSEKLEVLVGTGMQSNSLNPQYSWLCYADRMNGDDPLKAKVWEFKKMVRDLLNRLAFSEDDDEAIEIDPFTDPDEGLPVMVTYRKQPNKKKGEQYYEVSFPKKSTARPLTDEEIEYFMSLRPLSEVLPKYGMRDFERALEGLQNFDEENEIGLFDDDDWVEHVEEIKAQYDGEEEDDDDEDAKETKSTKKTVAKKTTKKVTKPEPEEEETAEDDDDDEEDDGEEDETEGDEFDKMSRDELKKYIRENGLEIPIKKSMDEEAFRTAIREALAKAEDAEDDDEDDDEEEEDAAPAKTKVSLDDIRKKLAGKK